MRHFPGGLDRQARLGYACLQIVPETFPGDVPGPAFGGGTTAMTKKPTILDIARLAGVSPATVSRVVNRRPDVDRQTRERVLRVVAEQGYVPNAAAAGLAGGRNRLIGMLLPLF